MRHVAPRWGIDTEEKSVAGLPTDRQSFGAAALADRKQQVSGIEAACRDYRAAPSAKVEESKAKLQTALDKVNSGLAQLDAKLLELEAK